MDIAAAGGETDLLKRLLSGPSGGPDVVVPNGDDAAVVRFGGELIAVTTDTMVEGRHFDWRFSTPEDVGRKAIEAAASDIVAMGGLPRHVYLALTAPRAFSLERLEGLYHGMHAACARLGAIILGGDTTIGADELVVTVTVVGCISSEAKLCTRSGARPGDLLCVTGPLGGAAAGLLALERGAAGFDDSKKLHRSPQCRIDCIDAIAERASAMIDVSDGLSSEVHHICRMSGVGAIVRAKDVPLHPETEPMSRMSGIESLVLALSGGDDYELLYTVPPSQLDGLIGTVIGEITTSRDVLLQRDGVREPLENRGYDHVRPR